MPFPSQSTTRSKSDASTYVEPTASAGSSTSTTCGLSRSDEVFGKDNVAPAADPAVPVRDTSQPSVDLHGVGVDLLLSLAPNLAR